MNKTIDLNGKLEGYKFDKNKESSLLRPFIMGKTNATNKESKEKVDFKFAVNMKDSEWLDVVIDDFGLKIIDNKSKGFCLEWKYIESIKEQNDFEIKDSDNEEENNRKECKFDEFIGLVFDVVLKEINKYQGGLK